MFVTVPAEVMSLVEFFVSKTLLLSSDRPFKVKGVCIFGAKKRWRDEVAKYLRTVDVVNWYVLCQDRKRWSNMCAVAVDEVTQCRERNACAANRASQEKTFLCNCGRHFRRQGDINVSVMCQTRH